MVDDRRLVSTRAACGNAFGAARRSRSAGCSSPTASTWTCTTRRAPRASTLARDCPSCASPGSSAATPTRPRAAPPRCARRPWSAALPASLPPSGHHRAQAATGRACRADGAGPPGHHQRGDGVRGGQGAPGPRVHPQRGARPSLSSALPCNTSARHQRCFVVTHRAQVARGRAIIPANKRHTELEPTIIGEGPPPFYFACTPRRIPCLLRARPLSSLSTPLGEMLI